MSKGHIISSATSSYSFKLFMTGTSNVQGPQGTQQQFSHMGSHGMTVRALEDHRMTPR